ncbi:hypothetical protein Vretimale_1620 [Volvox reticuliferus]|uniref:BTB domain-containing protein n=1 Tax=Volvox reticuliferus TaxID=1737510 RepID=A0A8J4FWT9_9CHLO|nr:hypothetical protein Vretifemale_15448 [Volvox reticuliferus]GIL95658.1 hypothetical protein Vretimale_1620 [Volvox reticuliferus]
MERLDFSNLWENERWSDVTLFIRPRCCGVVNERNTDYDFCPSSSTPAPPENERRVTRSMLKGAPAGPGRQQGKAGPQPSTLPLAHPARRRGASEQDTAKASRSARSAQGSLGKALRSASLPVPEAEAGPGAQPAGAGKAGTIDNLPPGSVIYPAHAAVLMSTSEYFRRYFDAWHPANGSKIVTIEVEPDEVEAAKMMLRYMYTGQLPLHGVDPSQLLRMIKLADQFSVNRFLATCNSALADVPLDSLTLDHVASILALPPFLLEDGEGPGGRGAGALAVARRRAEAKLTAVFGDLEGAWFDPVRRQEFLRLPLAAVKFLIRRTETAVYNENTTLVALTDWIAANSHSTTANHLNRHANGRDSNGGIDGSGNNPTGHAELEGAGDAAAPTAGTSDAGVAVTVHEVAVGTLHPSAPVTPRGGGGGGGGGAGGGGPVALTEVQMDELFGLIRLPHLSAAFMSLLPHVGWVSRRLTPQLLARVLQLVKAEVGPPGGGGGSGGAGGGPRGVGGDSRPLGGMYGNGALELLQRLTGPVAVPRAMPERTVLELEWTIHRSDVQALIAECQAEECVGAECRGGSGGSTGAGGCGSGSDEVAAVESTRLFSEPAYYYAGFYWRMCFFVQKKLEPKRRRLGDMQDVSGAVGGGGGAGGGAPAAAAAAAAGAGGGNGGAGGLGVNQGGGGGVDAAAADAGGGHRGGGGRDGGGSQRGEVAVYHDFLGVTCRAVLGGEEFAPLVYMNLELLAARFNALGEQLPAQRAEVPGYVDDEVPYGVYDFFRQDNLSDVSQLAPFVCRRNMLHLSCKITRCC